MLPLGILSGIFALFGWGVSDFTGAIASRKINNVRTLFWSLSIGSVIFLIFYIFTSLRLPVFTFSYLGIMFLAALLQATGGYFFFKGFQVGDVSIVSPIASSFGMWTVILAVIFLHETLSIFQIFQIGLIIIGIFLVSTDISKFIKKSKFLISDKGAKYAFIASLFWAISFILYSPLVKVNGWLISAICLRLLMLSCVFIFAFFTKKNLLFSPKKEITPFVLITASADVIGYSGYSIGLEHGLTAIVSPVAAAFPLVTVFLAQIYLKEKLVLNQIIGIVGIISGLILLSL